MLEWLVDDQRTVNDNQVICPECGSTNIINRVDVQFCADCMRPTNKRENESCQKAEMCVEMESGSQQTNNQVVVIQPPNNYKSEGSSDMIPVSLPRSR